MAGFATALDYVVADLGEHEDAYAARAMMADLGLDPAAKPATLSGGEARRAALVRVLSAEPDILLLDEPTNHLDLIAIEWLEKRWRESRAALARRQPRPPPDRRPDQLDRLARPRRDAPARPAASPPSRRGATRCSRRRSSQRHKLDRRIVEEEHWMRYGVTARRKRNMRRVGELRRCGASGARRAGSRASRPWSAQDAKSSGALVIEAEKIGKSYGGRPVVKDFSTRVMRGDRVGVVGANGAGKTTLIKLLSGALAPDSGEVRLGTNVAMAQLDQRRASLEPTTTLVDALTGGGSDYVRSTASASTSSAT